MSSSASLYANFKFKPRCFLFIFSSFLDESKSRNALTLTSGLKKNKLLTTNFVYFMETKNKLKKELLGSIMMFAAAYDWQMLDVSERLIIWKGYPTRKCCGWNCNGTKNSDCYLKKKWFEWKYWWNGKGCCQFLGWNCMTLSLQK